MGDSVTKIHWCKPVDKYQKVLCGSNVTDPAHKTRVPSAVTCTKCRAKMHKVSFTELLAVGAQ